MYQVAHHTAAARYNSLLLASLFFGCLDMQSIAAQILEESERRTAMWTIPRTLKLGQVRHYLSHGLQIKCFADRDAVPTGASGEHCVDLLGSKHLFVD